MGSYLNVERRRLPGCDETMRRCLEAHRSLSQFNVGSSAVV